MSDTAGTESVDTGAPAETTPGPSEQATSQPAGGGNPAWDELRSEVGETTFKLLEPHVKKWDTQASERIARTNEQLKQYTDLGDFESLSAGHSIARQLESDPVTFTKNLIGMLQERGMWEEAAAVQEELDESESSEEQDPRDREINDLKAALEQVQGRFQEQDTERLTQQWQSEWDTAFKAAQADEKSSWITEEDDGLLRTLAERHIESDDTPIAEAFSKALTDLSNYRNRVVSTPRANESAPRLIQAGGGNPAAAQPTEVSKLGRRDTVDVVTNFPKARRGTE